MTWVVVVVGLMLLVFLHELGHFTVALAVGIRPRSFYVGFPPAILKVKRKGIEYGLGAIPLGGLVRIPGMHRPAGKDVDAFMAPALREQPELAPFVQRVRRRLEEANYEGAREALDDLRREIEAAQLSPSALRSANRALRESTRERVSTPTGASRRGSASPSSRPAPSRTSSSRSSSSSPSS
jgi:membrane-associated protease RseP (regulator of RpoE activity)